MALIPCLIGLIIIAIVLAIVFYIIQVAFSSMLVLPPQVWVLIKLLVGLLVLLWFLNCTGILAGFGGAPGHGYGWRY
jgi:hypothetical protein